MRVIFQIIIIFFVIFSCEKYPTVDTVWPPDENSTAAPIITSVSPHADSAFGGFTILTISGENFLSDSGGNYIYIGGEKVSPASESANEIVVQAPSVFGDTISIRIVVPQAEKLASYDYRLQTLSEEYGGFTNLDKVRCIAMDSGGNLYSMMGDRTVRKTDPNGEYTEFGTTTFPQASEMRFGPNNTLFLIKVSNRVLYSIGEEGGEVQEYATFPDYVDDERVKLTSFDFDINNNIFLAGSGGGAFVIRADTSVNSLGIYVDFRINCVRVYDGHVYFAGTQVIYRNKILDDQGTLETEELVIDLAETEEFSSHDIKSITFSSDGKMIIGTDPNDGDADPILVMKTNGQLEALYSDQLMAPAYHVLWGNGSYIYVNRYHSDAQKRRIIKVNMLSGGAPYYGRQQ
jgi:hypothetical protein